MPWTAKSAHRHTKAANTPAKKKKWAKIAEGLRKKGMEEGRAIRIANAAVADEFWNGDTFLTDVWEDFCDRRIKTQRYNSRGQEEGYFEEEEEDRTRDALSEDKVEDETGEEEDAARGPQEEEEEEEEEQEEEEEEEEGNIGERISDWRCPDYRSPFRDAVYDREVSREKRKELAEKGHALKGGGYPIETKGDLRNAMRAIGRAKNRAATIRLIRKRAKALGVDIGENWPNKDSFERTKCPECGGRGMLHGKTCETCEGEGFVNRAEARSYDSSLVQFSDTPHSMTLYDTVELDDDAKVRYTADGYLVATPRVARTGIQLYHGEECGRDDVKIIRVFRSEDEVFHPEAVRSLTHRPVTLDHPAESLNANNWKKYAVGQTGDEVLRDGGTIRVPMVLMDHAAIEAYENGTNQLSVGYDCDLEWGGGTTDDGEEYDAVQRNIRANHLAVVAAARGGSSLRIGDEEDSDLMKGESAMNTVTNSLRTITVDGFNCQVTERDAEIISRTISKLEQQLKDAKKREEEREEEDEDEEEEKGKKDAALKAANATLKSKDDDLSKKDEALKAKDGEIAVLKQQLKDAEVTPGKLNSYVIERLGVINKAKTILGDKYGVGEKSNDEIRKDVVIAKMGDVAKTYDTPTIKGAFEALSTIRMNDAVPQRGSVDDVIRAFQGEGAFQGRPGPGYTRVNQTEQAYADYDRGIQDAWRGPQHGGPSQV